MSEKLGADDRTHFQPTDFDVPLHDQVSLAALVTSAADSQLFVSKQLFLVFPKRPKSRKRRTARAKEHQEKNKVFHRLDHVFFMREDPENSPGVNKKYVLESRETAVFYLRNHAMKGLPSIYRV